MFSKKLLPKIISDLISALADLYGDDLSHALNSLN